MLLILTGISLIIFYTTGLKANQTIEVKEAEPFTYVSITHKGSYSDIPMVIEMLMYNSRNQNIFPAGPTFGIFHHNPSDPRQETSWEIGFPINPPVFPQDPLRLNQWQYPLVVVSSYIKGKDDPQEVYDRIYNWMNETGYRQQGPIMERYLIDQPEDIEKDGGKVEIWIACQKKD